MALGASAGTGSFNTYVGETARHSGSNDPSYALGLGSKTAADANGSVAIGTDSGGVGASSTVANQFVLGTANHRYLMPGLPTANPGAGSGILWSNAGVVTVA